LVDHGMSDTVWWMAVSPEMFEDPVTGQTLHKTHVEAAVSVIDTSTNLVSWVLPEMSDFPCRSHFCPWGTQARIWNFDKFMTRLYLMRERFDAFQQGEE
jgi:hypothetical protein